MPKAFSTKSNHLSYYLKINSITNTRFDSYTCTFPIFRKSAGLNWQKITCTFAIFSICAGLKTKITCKKLDFGKSAGAKMAKITCTFALFVKSAGAEKYCYIIILQAMGPEAHKRLLKQENLNDE